MKLRGDGVMKTYVLPGLMANAATLGIHWIYDYQYLHQLSQTSSLLFRIQNKDIYDQAEISYFSYPHQKLGDVTVQGHMMMWLYDALLKKPEFGRLAYEDMLYEHFKPGGSYIGYVESYAQKLVLNQIAKNQHIDFPPVTIHDNHLVGFIPYLVCKELGLSIEKAWDLAQVFTDDPNYFAFYKMFDELFNKIHELGLKEALKSAIHLSPEAYRLSLTQALEMQDTNRFIEDYAGRACAIMSSVPVICHILYHTHSYHEASLKNAAIGGAVADRATIIGAIYAQISKIPSEYEVVLKDGAIAKFMSLYRDDKPTKNK
jgi:hypothetical protein